MKLNRRSLLRGFAGIVAAVPLAAIASKLPGPVSIPIRKIDKWATAEIVGGKITKVTIINSGSGYHSPYIISFNPPIKEPTNEH